MIGLCGNFFPFFTQAQQGWQFLLQGLHWRKEIAHFFNPFQDFVRLENQQIGVLFL